MSKPPKSDRLNFFARVSRDADELISRTIVEATGKDFVDFVEAGKPPPLSLFFKAYFHTACFHCGKAAQQTFSQAAHRPEKVQAERPHHANEAELLNPDGEIIGYTDVSID